MKKLLTTISILIALTSQAQSKDTTVALTLKINDFRALMAAIDANVDSKKVSKELLEFIQKNTQIVADKPKK
jgi:menaquinone-dependent protoporphyrinogen IX oxidase